MTITELSALVQKRANEAYSDLQAASKLKPAKRAKAMGLALKMQAACDVAADILGERDTTDQDKEERIKHLFLVARD